MKRVLMRILSLIIVLGLVGCSSTPADGTNTTEPTKKVEERQELKVGDVAINSVAEFTLEKLDFGKALSNTIDDNYLLPDDAKSYSKNPFNADDGNMMISISYTIKNTGKEELDIYNWSYDIIYDGEYTFSNEEEISEYYFRNDKWENYQYGRYIEPLTSKKYRSYIQVPKEVYENEDLPLSFVIHMYEPTDDKDNYDIMFGDTYLKESIVTYKIR